MPYITSETVKAKRKELRAMFPAKAGWKLVRPQVPPQRY